MVEMIGHRKQDIRDKLRTVSVWVTQVRTPLFGTVPEPRMRYVVAIWISGNAQQAADIMFEKLKEDATYETVWSPIVVAPADFRQIPEGSYDLEDSIVTFEGGTRLYGRVTGMSLNVSVNFWDNEAW